MALCKYRRHDYICDREATGHGFCILHFPEFEKDPEAFEEALDAHREKHGDTFNGFVFPDSFTFENNKFKDGVSFAESKFKDFAGFKGAEFSGKAVFRNAEFNGQADFSAAKFTGYANFHHAELSADVRFNDAQFKGNAGFLDARFGKSARFVDAKFFKDAYFDEATFGDDAECGKDDHFRGRTDFSRAKFGGLVIFGSAKFKKDVYFSKAEFSGNAKFYSAEFSKEADFSEAEFSGDADFRCVKFKRAVFQYARVDRDADFSYAEFNKDANFEAAEFGGEVRYKNAKFGQKAVFEFARFGGGATFDGTELSRDVSFQSARFHNRTLFVVGKEHGKPIQLFPGTGSGAECDFTNAIIAPLDALILRDVDLTKCRFQGTDLRKAEITNATWPEAIVRRFGYKISLRKLVYDEGPLPKGRSRLLTFLTSFSPFASYQRPVETPHNTDEASWPQVEQLYRQLKQNYEDRRDYERARDFHYGEKEMRRRNPKTSRGLKFLLFLYKWVSGYGERALRPLIWMAIVLAASTCCYLNWGLHRLRDLRADLDVTDLWDVGLYSLQVMLLLKPINFEPVGFCGGAIYTAQSILGPLLIGLFALAIRQRLKR